jgi:hypothetical protein
MTSRTLRILAGPEAFHQIRSRGLQADDIQVVTGAAGGPKWLALSHLDRFLFGSWFHGRQEPLHLIGSSAGAWRLAAASTSDPLGSITRFEDLYIDQQYSLRPTAPEVSSRSLAIVQGFLGTGGAASVLGHPFQRLNILVNRCRGPLASERPAFLQAALGSVGLSSVVVRPAITAWIDRYVAHDPRQPAPLSPALTRREFKLSAANLAETLLASGSIPVVMSGVRDIEGADGGVYRDGGLLDYHLDLPLELSPGKLVLCPHFITRVIPGWFDRFAPWRKARHGSRTVLVVPSDEFVRTLPGGKIPCRRDFYAFAGRDQDRKHAWRKAVSDCRRLADEFAEVLGSGRIGDVLERL